MKTGIIVYSKTGNTLSVAEKLLEALQAEGKAAELKRITAEELSGGKFRLLSSPDISGYDALIFASPVWAFTLSSVMKQYFSALPSMQGKKVSCFVTTGFKNSHLGGNRAIRYMNKAILSKGGKVSETGVVNWPIQEKEAQIKDLVQRLCESSI